MNVNGTGPCSRRLFSSLEETTGQTAKRSRTRAEDRNFQQLISEDPKVVAFNEFNQATTIVGQLSEKANQIQILFESVIQRYPTIALNPTFAANYSRLQTIRQHNEECIGLLRSQPVIGATEILNRQERAVTELLWMNTLELVTANIISEIDR